MNGRFRMFFYGSMIILLALISAFSVIPARADDGAPPPPAAPAAPASAPAAPSSDAPAAPANPPAAPASDAAPAAPAAPSNDAAPSAPAAPANPPAAPAGDTAPAAPANPPAAPASDAAPANPAPTDAAPVAPAAPAASASNVAPTDAAPAAPATDAAPTDAAPTNVAPTIAAAPAMDTPAALSQVPAGTNVVVLNAAGASVPLASQEAAAIVATGDPMWCPTGVTPGGAGCSASTTNFNGGGGLLSLISGKTVPGTIWIAASYTSAGEGGLVTINGGSLGTTQNFALTIKGGWNGTLGSTTISGTSTFNVPLTVNWNADVTLSDIEITAVPGSATALTVTTPRNVTLTRVNVHDNTGAGAHIDNHTGTGNVTVSSSTFSNNGTLDGLSDGLNVLSKGSISLNTVTASFNGHYGANLDNTTAATPQAITFTGTNVFNNNWGDGLDALGRGVITLASLTANSNGTGTVTPTPTLADGIGVYVDNRFSPAAPQDVIINGTNTFTGNWLEGLEVESYGAITVNSVTASSNGQENTSSGYLYGVKLDNCQYDSGTSLCKTVVPKPVNITGTNVLSGNLVDDGLKVYSKGAITANNLTANSNGNDGVYLENDYTGAVGGVTLTGLNTFNSNVNTGLEVYSKGAITANNLTANDSFNNWGAYLENDTGTGGVTLTGLNTFIGNGGTGLEIWSKGAITTNNLAANNNFGDYGTHIDNSAGSGGVTLNGTNTFNANWMSGLEVYSKGAITANNLTADGNIVSYGVYLQNNFPGAVGGVTLTGLNNFIGNNGSGLEVHTKGAIITNNLTSTGSGEYGVDLENNAAGSTASITVGGVNTFTANQYAGLQALSFGAITVNSVTAKDNGISGMVVSYGLYLDNCLVDIATNHCTAAGTPAVTLTGTSNLNGNQGGGGLFVNSKGVITVNNVRAKDNTFGFGAFLDNCLYDGPTTSCNITTPSNVTMTGTNVFLNNGYDGLRVWSGGIITLNNVTANGNGTDASRPGPTDPLDTTNGILTVDGTGKGAYLNNYGALTAKALTVNTLTANGNADAGLFIEAYGAVTANNLTANSNGHVCTTGDPSYICDGVHINDAASFTLTGGSNTFNANGDDGLDVNSWSTASLSNVHADGNTQWGTTIYATGAATLLGFNSFTNNGYIGLEVWSRTGITLNNVTANNNGTGPGAGSDTDGVRLDTCFYGNTTPGLCDVTGKPVSLLGTNTFNSNIGNGLEVYSSGAITLNSVTADTNGNYGAALENDFSNASGAVTLTGSNDMSGNNNSGLYVSSRGAITVNGLTANNNGGYGAHLVNNFPSVLQLVTVNGGFFTGNGSSPQLFIESNLISKLNSVPQWCPTGVAPGGAGCSHTYLTLQDLVSDVGVGFHPAANGVIWIQNTTFASSGAIIFNGGIAGNWATWSGFSLTLQGGWTGPGTATGTPTTLQDALSIINWHAAVTLNDIVITGVTTAPGTSALNVSSTGNITLTRVNVNDNSATGADLFNSGGPGTVTVSVSASNFSNNHGGNGLNVWSRGLITLKDIDASGNNNDGAYLNNISGTSGVTLTGLNVLSQNNSMGLEVYTNGAINLSNIVADVNSGPGAWLDNCKAYLDLVHGYCTVPADTMPVNLTGTNEFKFNSAGLVILTNGAVTTNNLTASNNNTNSGAWIDNSLSTAGALVTMNGTNFFNNNNDSGLNVYSKGVITLNNVTANGNNGSGAWLDNCIANGSGGCLVTSPKAVNLNVSGGNPDNTFRNNDMDGLDVYSLGALSLTGVTADGNNGDGVYLKNSYTTAVGTITFNGWGTEAGNNSNNGLEIYSKGAISATAMWAWNNTGSGAFLNNTYGTGTVTIGSVGGTSFGSNGDDGLDVLSRGAITLNNPNTWHNGNTNYYNEKNSLPIDHTLFYSGFGIYLDNSTALAPQTVSITGSSNFDSDFDSGLVIYSKGAIAVNNLQSNNDHTNMGAVLDNTASGHLTGQNITITGYGRFNNNYYTGLSVETYGMVTLNNLDANNNGVNGGGSGSGVSIDNYGPFADGPATLPKTVTLNGNNNFNGNYDSGLLVRSLGAISVNNLSAHNSGWGASLDNTLGGPANQQNVTITGYSDIGNNNGTGLTVYSFGAITLTNLNAQSNGQSGGFGDGVDLDNSESSNHLTAATAARAVMINGGSNTDNNHDIGLFVNSLGAITIANLEASNKNWDGVFLNNDHPNASGGVTLTGSVNTTDNLGSGLQILSRGLISITIPGTRVGNNGGWGWSLDNSSSLSHAGVTVTMPANNGINFDNNGAVGLLVQSAGVITLNNLGAHNNGAAGVVLDNTSSGPASPQNVTVNGYSNYNNNGDDGLEVFSYGVIALNNIDSGNNGQNNFYNQSQGDPILYPIDPMTGWGVYLDNCSFVWVTPASNSGCTSTGTPKGITLTGWNNFHQNFQVGLWATSLGPISVIEPNADSNGGTGVYLDNQWTGAVGGITVTSATANDTNNFSNNGMGYLNGYDYGDGLDAYSNGAITINNLDSSNNGSMGVYIDNVYGNPASPQNVTVNGYARFNNNGDDGLDVFSYGVITISNIDANSDGQHNFKSTGWGAYLDNCGFDWGTHQCTSTGAPKGITLVGKSNFSGNYQDGLWATSLGPISAIQMNADSNGGDGAYLDNRWTGAVGGINVTTTTPSDLNMFTNNGHGWLNGHTIGNGLSAYSNGAITLNNILANNNGANGAYVVTAHHIGDYAAQNVTLSGRNIYRNNGSDGLDVYADGNIAINNLDVRNNGQTNFYNQGQLPPLPIDPNIGWGVYLDNCLYDSVSLDACAGHGDITLTGTNTSNGNFFDGLWASSHGNLVLNNMTADNNGGRGVYADADGTILVACGSMNHNGSYGWDFWSPSTVTLKVVTAYGNNGGGANTLLENGTLITSRTCP